MATKKSATETTAPKSMPKEGKDPKGGLTDVGRKFFAQKDGSHLKPGVQGRADTPEKMQRKGSFLRRHFANPPGPVVDNKGKPTRQALQAAAWGEPVPTSEADEKRLAEKGTELLEHYHQAKDGKPSGLKAPAATKKAGRKAPSEGVAAKQAGTKPPPAKQVAAKKTPAKKVAAKKTPAKSSSQKGVPKKTPAAKQQAAKAIAKRSR